MCLAPRIDSETSESKDVTSLLSIERAEEEVESLKSDSSFVDEEEEEKNKSSSSFAAIKEHPEIQIDNLIEESKQEGEFPPSP